VNVYQFRGFSIIACRKDLAAIAHHGPFLEPERVDAAEMLRLDACLTEAKLALHRVRH
jgi:hypothetical protein